MKTQAEIYAKMHERRFDFIEERRRARDYQAQLAEARDELSDVLLFNLKLSESNAAILELVAKHAERYSRGSVTRVALDTIALDIMELVAK